MDIKSIIGKKVAVHCQNKKQVEKFIQSCKLLKIDDDYRFDWNDFSYQICFRFTNNCIFYDTASSYRSQGYTIIEYNSMSCESLNIDITTNKSGNKINAIMKNSEGKYIKHATAKCSPEDEFDYEYGKKLALSRLFGLDELNTIYNKKDIISYQQEKPIYLFHLTSGKTYTGIGERTSFEDISQNQLYVGDVVEVLHSHQETQLAFVYSYIEYNKRYYGIHNIYGNVGENGLGCCGDRFFAVKKVKSYNEIKVGDVFGYLEVRQ